MTEKCRVVVVSACLLGRPCRYDGGDCAEPNLPARLAGCRVVEVCPEQLGGLPTPRTPAEFKGGDGRALLDSTARLEDRDGRDVTREFLSGAAIALSLALDAGAESAILKERSPSCGVTLTHQDDRLVSGQGVFAAMLARAGIPIEGI